jgi:hypothetical protein
MTKPPRPTNVGPDGRFAVRSPTPVAVRWHLEPGDLGTVIRLHGREAAEHGLDASFEAEVARGVGAPSNGLDALAGCRQTVACGSPR